MDLLFFNDLKLIFKLKSIFLVKKFTNHGEVLGMLRILKSSKSKIVTFSLFLAVFSQVGHTAAIKDTNKLVSPSVAVAPQSPIERALNLKASKMDKKGDYKLIADNDQFKVLTSIQAVPTQNFLAEQHQRFSRFVQNWIQPHTS